MGRKKTATMPNLQEEKAPVRVSKRASTSQFATSKLQKQVEKMPELEKERAKPTRKSETTPPPAKNARRSSSKSKPATREEVEEPNGTSESVNVQVPSTLEEMKRIIGADCFSTPVAVEKTPEKPKEAIPADVEEVLTEHRVPRRESRKGRPSKTKSDVVVPVVDTPSSVETIAERAGKRQKREKVIFDPSDSNVRSRKRSKLSTSDERPEAPKQKTPSKSDSKKSPRPTSVTPKKPAVEAVTAPTTPPRPPIFDPTKLTMIKQKFGQFCYVCLSAKGNLEQTCPRCGSRVHNKCLEEQKYLTSVRILGDDWICQNCCECSVCLANTMTSKTSDDDDEMFVCVTCKKFYHAHCHRPSLTSKPIMKGTWKCHTCAEQLRAQRHTAKEHSTKPNGTIDLDLTTVAPTRSRAFTQHKPRNIALKLPPRLNQLHEWTVDEVYRYFALHFPDHAGLFRDQEIDGAVLLLMRRSDVLQGFGNIKLGTAINIFRHIVMMQTKSNDPSQTWY